MAGTSRQNDQSDQSDLYADHDDHSDENDAECVKMTGRATNAGLVLFCDLILPILLSCASHSAFLRPLLQASSTQPEALLMG
jgi:hypothetical protein